MARRTLPPGRQFYDVYNGARVGGLAGALIGGGVAVMTAAAVFVFVGAALGGVGGYLWEKRAQQRDLAAR